MSELLFFAGEENNRLQPQWGKLPLLPSEAALWSRAEGGVRNPLPDGWSEYREERGALLSSWEREREDWQHEARLQGDHVLFHPVARN